MFQTDGPMSKNDPSRDSVVLTQVATKLRVSDADRNFLVRVYG